MDRKRQSLAEVLGRQICQMIIDRQLQSGDLLPTEHQLTAEFAVGRSSLREAIVRLRALDIVDVRHGHGTFVANVAAAVLHTGLRDADLIGDASEKPSSVSLKDLARDLSSLRQRAETLRHDDIGALLRMAEDRIASRITSASQQDADEGHPPASLA